MNYARINKLEVANGPGFRISLFTQGCAKAMCGHPCPGCFNSVTWDPAGGKPFTVATAKHILDLLSPDFIKGLSVLGGEPLDVDNVAELSLLFKEIKSTYHDKTVWVWTGYTWEQLKERADWDDLKQLLQHVDVLIDGPFVEAQKDLSLAFRGSANQRVIDVQKSLNGNEVVSYLV